MARSRPIDLAGLERAGKQALARLRISPNDLPQRYRHAQGYAVLVRSLAKDLPASASYVRDRAAVDKWAESARLFEAATRLYNDPRVRSIVNNDEATLQYYWNNPEKLMPILAKHSVEFPQSYSDNGPVAEVMKILGSYQSFEADHSSGPGPASQVEQAGERASTPQPPVDRARGPGNGAGKSAHRPSPSASSAAQANAEWSAAVAAYERTHPLSEEEDPNADLPDSYWGIEEPKNADENH